VAAALAPAIQQGVQQAAAQPGPSAEEMASAPAVSLPAAERTSPAAEPAQPVPSSRQAAAAALAPLLVASLSQQLQSAGQLSPPAAEEGAGQLSPPAAEEEGTALKSQPVAALPLLLPEALPAPAAEEAAVPAAETPPAPAAEEAAAPAAQDAAAPATEAAPGLAGVLAGLSATPQAAKQPAAAPTEPTEQAAGAAGTGDGGSSSSTTVAIAVGTGCGVALLLLGAPSPGEASQACPAAADVPRLSTPCPPSPRCPLQLEAAPGTLWPAGASAAPAPQTAHRLGPRRVRMVASRAGSWS
jgi:hypothetical protein